MRASPRRHVPVSALLLVAACREPPTAAPRRPFRACHSRRRSPLRPRRRTCNEYLLGRTGLWLTDYANRSIDEELYDRGAFGPLGIGARDRRGTVLSLEAAERVARMFADGGVFGGVRILPERFVARVTAEKLLAWEAIGEGELAVITQPIFDSWRLVPSIDRSLFKAVEPLIDRAIPVDEFGEALAEKLGRQSDTFRNELMKARKQMFERRWRSTIGFGSFGHMDAVVVLSQTKLIAVYASPAPDHGVRAVLPLLRALE